MVALRRMKTRSLTRLPSEFPGDQFRKLSFEEWFNRLSRNMQAFVCFFPAIPALYIFAGILRAFSVLAYRHAPIYEPWVDWWWMWVAKWLFK